MEPSVGWPRRMPKSFRAYASSLTVAEHGHEGFLADLDVADCLHSILTLFLFLQQFAFASDVTAVTLSRHILSHRGNRFSRDHSAADGGLYGDFEHVPFDLGLQTFSHCPPTTIGIGAVAYHAQRIDPIA